MFAVPRSVARNDLFIDLPRVPGAVRHLISRIGPVLPIADGDGRNSSADRLGADRAGRHPRFTSVTFDATANLLLEQSRTHDLPMLLPVNGGSARTESPAE
jgi:hypothetical protein